MNFFYVVILYLFFLISFCFANPIIRVGNFSGESVEIVMGELEKPSIELYDLQHTEVTQTIHTIKQGQYSFYFRVNNTNDWVSLTDDNGNKAVYQLNDNGVYMFIFGYSGIPYCIDLSSHKKSDDGLFYILNESGREINLLKITDDWEYGQKGLFLKEIGSGDLIGPENIEYGKWKIMWSYSDDPKIERYFVYPNSKNTTIEEPLIIDYTNSVKYFMVLYRDLMGESVRLFDW